MTTHSARSDQSGPHEENHRPDPPPAQAVSFEDWYKRDMPGLVLFAMMLGARKEDARDLAQQAFADAYPRWDTIDFPRAYLRTCISRAYERRHATLQRYETCTDSIVESTAPADPAVGRIEIHDQEQRILTEIRRLKPGQREVMAWTLDGYEPAEIASILGKSQGAVRASLYKARRNLRHALASRKED
ncbi:sigma-70 family RNA polymerase sigma factor [Nocardiopsis sp. NPDC049922]|uniref:sigma-70 family RNA polymerase sigma factor n=1 Tax=Nocardiopsis sp. NPDC049922 TaxID=3155157 RepID=UPI0033ECBC27